LESQKAIVEHFAEKDKAIIKNTSKQKAVKKLLIEQNYSKLLIIDSFYNNKDQSQPKKFT